MKEFLSLLVSLSMITAFASCSDKKSSSTKPETETTASASTEASSVASTEAETSEYKYEKYASMTPEEIVAELTLEQKAAQMVEPVVYLLMDDIEDMKAKDYGSVLGNMSGAEQSDWVEITDELQQNAIESECGIPMIYGQDHAHGVNYCTGAVYFPHNIGIGAANDANLTYEMGRITADEAMMCHMPWNFFPVVSQSVDPRWGRTYECYGADLDMISKLGTSYIKGYIDGGGVACAKHFFAEGSAVYGTGEDSDMNGVFTDRLIDRGNAELTDDEIAELLQVYQDMIDAGAQTIMISHASLNGVKMHENKEYIMKLKDEMGFEGFIVSDWNSIQNIPDKTYEEQVIAAVNAGIDMFMEPERYSEAMDIIVESVKKGVIPLERLDDAVTRIIRVKKNAGLFDDPMLRDFKTKQQNTGSSEYRKIAEKLVEESLVLLKNDNDVLPIKEGSSVYIIGPASDDAAAQCGGWTIDWNGSESKKIDGVTTIVEGFKAVAAEYDIKVITNPKEAADADIVLNVVGEEAYAEWNGDTEDMELCGKLGLTDNRRAIDEAKSLGKPTVTCIVAGRQVILDKADMDSWDSVVMCYLPGSEGQGVANVLCGGADFSGKLPSPWYGSVAQIGTDECMFEMGYGLTYGDDFKALNEPVQTVSGDSAT